MNKILDIILLLAYSICLAIYMLAVPYADFNVLHTMGMWGVALFVLCAYTWYKSGNELVSLYFFFLSVLFIFTYGQSLMYAFDLVSERRDLIGKRGITIPLVYEAQKATLYMLASFHIGALIMNFLDRNRKRTIVVDDEESGLNYSKTITALKKIGIFLFIISFLPYMYGLIQEMIFSMKYGYGILYVGEAKIGFANSLEFIADLFMPSVICLFIGYQDNKNVRKLLYGLCSFIIVVILLTGGRSNAVILASLLVLLQHIVIKRISRRQFLMIGCGGIFFLGLLSTIADLRNTSDRSIDSYIETSNKSKNGVVDAVAEMGGSMFPLIKTQAIVPEYENYRYGRSYLYAFSTIIPNMGFWEIHPAKKESNLGNWLTKKLNYSYGTGYSMCAEAYINFGVFAPLMMLILGMLFQSIFRIGQTNKDLSYLVFSFIVFWFCLKMPRNSFINFVRAFAYYALPIYYYVKVKSRQG